MSGLDDIIQAVASGSIENSQKEKPKRKYDGSSRKPLVAQCEFCGLFVKHPSRIEAHMRTHSGEKPYKCEICGQKFSLERPLRIHVMKKHTNDRPFKCEESLCKAAFVTNSELNEHMKTKHFDVKRYICNAPGCTRMFSRLVYLRNHRQTVHSHLYAEDRKISRNNPGMAREKEESIEVEEIRGIQESSPETSGIQERVAVREEENLYYNFESQEVIEVISNDAVLVEYEVPGPSDEVHEVVYLEREDIAFEQDVIGYENSNQIQEYNVELVEEEIVEMDHRMVATFEEIRNHDEEQPETSHENDMEDEELDLETYEMINRDEESREIPKNSKKGRKKKANNLDWVIDAVSRGVAVDSASPHNRRKPTMHKCKYCGRVDKYPSRIAAHMRTHTGEKPYKCDICGMGFAQKTPMRLHMRRHLDQKP
ncbi:hypothetical protein WR25_04237 [Diploscapter pachys]|uniref:C2H2-type domain-containing protein n=1 Tax=Diploscapter pachys TaxID=2018661 RepID=A0A2A2K128_9BILA|nr:hypothetical protein WR25_04237 [Diploscapter pachys]